MKNLKLLLVFVPLFTIACSDEYLSENTENAQTLNDLDKANNHAMQRKRKDKEVWYLEFMLWSCFDGSKFYRVNILLLWCSY